VKLLFFIACVAAFLGIGIYFGIQIMAYREALLRHEDDPSFRRLATLRMPLLFTGDLPEHCKPYPRRILFSFAAAWAVWGLYALSILYVK